jgi:uncharacterized protein
VGPDRAASVSNNCDRGTAICRRYQARQRASSVGHRYSLPALDEPPAAALVEASVENGFAMPNLIVSPYVSTILLLIGSNVFMTTAWYWHLRFREVPLWQVVLVSWGLALIEYCLAVPANRYGSYVYSAAQLKTIQEVITLSVFAVFSILYLHQGVTWNQVLGFGLIAAGAFFVFRAPI